MVSEKAGNMTTIQETKTMDSQATATSQAQPGPMEKPTKDPSNPAPSRGNLSHPGLSSMPHIMSDKAVLEEFGSSREQGLSTKQAEAARQKWGDNIIQPPPKPSPLKLLGRQIVNAMTIVLLAAMAVSFGTQDWIAAGVIAALVILNVSVGFSQEWKAEKTVAALASVGAPVAVCLRGGKEIQVKAEEVVPGDVMLMSPGSIVAADGRLLEGSVSNLETDEALLTGESLPVAKNADISEQADMPIGDRLCMVYAGSQITKGRARAVVVGTAMNTELGKIAEAIERKVTTKEKGWKAKWHKVMVALGLRETTPLQIKLNRIAYLLLTIAVILAIIVVASTAFVDIDPSIATYAVATAVSILPASLIAVVSLTLATASRELAKRNALVRRMDAIEGLAVVTDICSDKTGTLTVGKMVMKKAWIPARLPDSDSNENTTMKPAKVATDIGQTYEVETGSDPYYPRGVVRAIENDKPLMTESPSEDDEGSGPGNSESDDETSGPDVVSTNDMEQNLENMVLCASLCNMSTIHHGKEGYWQANGDATEVALQVWAHKMGRGKPHMTKAKRPHHGERTQSHAPLQRNNSTVSTGIHKVPVDGHFELVVEHPFDSTIKRMSTVWQHVNDDGSSSQSGCIAFLKGAVERVLDRCEYIGLGDDKIPLSESEKANIISRMDALAAEGLRVLCLSGKRINSRAEQLKTMPRDELESGMSFLGLAGIYDPPRPQSRGAVLEAQQAGITTRMLTGDHPATASAIARSVAILDDSHGTGAVMTGQQFDSLSEDEIDALPELPVVIARCAPETKVRMVEALHRRKVFGMTRFAVMTGDGVNDSPALKRADVGVAMGLNGSDVAKSVSDIVLADDNFASITRAIRKGRATFSNLSKFLLYLLSGNIAEVLVMLIGLAFKNERGISVYPLSPVAALWINTIAAGPPALALGLEPTAKDAMDHTPAAYRTIFTKWWIADLFYYGFLIGSLTLVNFIIVVWGRGDGYLGLDCNEGAYNDTCELLFHGRSAAFATLTILLMIHSLECKHLELSIFQMNLLDNKLLLWSAFALSLTVFPIIYIPRISDYAFQVLSIGWEWGIVFGMILVYLVMTELWKLMKRRLTRGQNQGGRKMTVKEKNLPRFETMAE